MLNLTCNGKSNTTSSTTTNVLHRVDNDSDKDLGTGGKFLTLYRLKLA